MSQLCLCQEKAKLSMFTLLSVYISIPSGGLLPSPGRKARTDIDPCSWSQHRPRSTTFLSCHLYSIYAKGEKSLKIISKRCICCNYDNLEYTWKAAAAVRYMCSLVILQPMQWEGSTWISYQDRWSEEDIHYRGKISWIFSGIITNLN